MNILHISPYVPDVRTNHAGGVCMGKEIEALRKNHNVSVLTFVNNEMDEKLIKDHPDFEYVRIDKKDFVKKVLMYPHMPNLFAIRRSKEFEKKLINIIERDHIDVIHAEYTAMGQYWKIKQKYPHIKFNLVEHDVVLQSYTRLSEKNKGIKKLYYQIQRKAVQKYEKEYCDHSDVVFTLNEKDRALMSRLYGIENSRVITPYYGVDFTVENTVEKMEKSICFVGQMGREENHLAAMRLIRLFRQTGRDDYTLTFIGAHPKEELLKEAADNIRITGFVDDINAEIKKHEFAVFPLTLGAGIKFKVLLALGLGLPVVTTSVGAEGIDEKGDVLLLAESDEEITAAMKKLMDDREYLEKLSEKSSQFVQDHFGWEKTERLFEEIYG